MSLLTTHSNYFHKFVDNRPFLGSGLWHPTHSLLYSNQSVYLWVLHLVETYQINHWVPKKRRNLWSDSINRRFTCEGTYLAQLSQYDRLQISVAFVWYCNWSSIHNSIGRFVPFGESVEINSSWNSLGNSLGNSLVLSITCDCLEQWEIYRVSTQYS